MVILKEIGSRDHKEKAIFCLSNSQLIIKTYLRLLKCNYFFFVTQDFESM